MTDAVLNGTWATPAASGAPGAAEDWTRAAYQQLPGWAAFGEVGSSTAPAERFLRSDAPARGVGALPGPFAVPLPVTLSPAAAGASPVNVFTFAGVDLRAALPPGSGFALSGGGGQQDGIWTVEAVALVGPDSVVTVVEDVWSVDVVGVTATIPPILECEACDHGWAAAVVDTTVYPVAPLAPGDTVGVRVDRGALQVLAFPGGETSAEQIVDVLSDLIVGGGARVTGGQVEVYSDTVGPGSSVQVEAGTAALTFDAAEVRGRGQWAQLWPAYFAVPAAATADEIVAVLDAHWAQARVSRRGAVGADDEIRVETARAGAGATLAIDDPVGGIHDAAAWPIPARVPGVDDELALEVDGTPLTVTLAPAAVTPALVAASVTTAVQAAGLDATAAASADRVYLDSRLAILCTGGSANADLGFPTTWRAYGGGRAARVLGLAGVAEVGSDHDAPAESFDDVPSVVATFAAGSDAAATAEAFVWCDTISAFDDLASVEGEFSSFVPAWLVAAETFDAGWLGEWLGTYVPATPQAGAWVPPGIAPDARIVGRPLTFPVTVITNRARLAVHCETDQTWYTLVLTPAVYADAAALIAELEARRVASGIPGDVEFSVTDDGAVALGWDRSAGGAGALHLGAPRGAFSAQDARPTLGLAPVAADPGLAGIDVPAGFYAGAPVGTWDAADAYRVDPYARLVFTAVADPATGDWETPVNGLVPALFHTLDGALADSYADEFDWVTETPGGAYPGWPLATFDGGLTYEDFEGVW